MTTLPTSIKAIVLDIGGVVLKINWAATFEKLQISSEEGAQLKQFIGAWHIYDCYERGHISSDHFFNNLIAERKWKHDSKIVLEAWNALILGPQEGIEDLLSSIGKNLPLYALSNTNQAHYEYETVAFPVFHAFRKMFLSFELGLRKPEQLIFRAVAEELKLDPSHILFVDDNPHYVEAARKAEFIAEQSVDSTETLASILQKHGCF